MLFPFHKVFRHLDIKVRQPCIDDHHLSGMRRLSRFLIRERKSLWLNVAAVWIRMCTDDREGWEWNIETKKGGTNEQRIKWGKRETDIEGEQKQPWVNLIENTISSLVFSVVCPGQWLWYGWRCWRRKTEGVISSGLEPGFSWTFSQGTCMSRLSHRKCLVLLELPGPAGAKIFKMSCYTTWRNKCNWKNMESGSLSLLFLPAISCSLEHSATLGLESKPHHSAGFPGGLGWLLGVGAEEGFSPSNLAHPHCRR